MKNIVILISGGGSNMAAIVRTATRDAWSERYGARVAGVISNNPRAGGLAFARDHGIETTVLDHTLFDSRDAFDAALWKVIGQYDGPLQPCLVVLAGFMRIFTPGFVSRCEGRLINIHPSFAVAGLYWLALAPARPGRRLQIRRCDRPSSDGRGGPRSDPRSGGGAGLKGRHR